MRCVPHAVSAAIMTHTDQRRRHDCRAGIMLREVPSRHDRGRQSAREEYISMRAVHEQEALPGLSALADHDIHSPTSVHDDDVFSALTLDERPWEELAIAGTSSVADPTSEQDLNAADPETDNVIAQYFGEVQHFALLSFAEEQALARRITRWQRRVRWALYTAPIALPTLRRLWHHVEHQDISVHEVVQAHKGATLDPAAQEEQCQQALRHLQAITAHLRRLEAQDGRPLGATRAQRGRYHESFRLWRAWLT